MVQRWWSMEQGLGPHRKRTWRSIFSFYGNEIDGADLHVRFFLGTLVRWHPLGEEFPCSYGPDPHSKYDAGEF